MRERARSIKNTTDFLITPTMYAPLETSLVLRKGTGDPTWSRATKAWGFNELGYLEELASGCAFFGGARLVRNTVRTKSEDFSSAAWVKAALTVSGTNTVVCANATSQQFIYQTPSGTSITTGQVLLCCVRLKYVSGGADFVQIAPGSSGFGTGQYATISLLDGSTNVVGCTATATLVAADTYDFCARFTATATGAFETWNVCFVGSLAAGRIPNFVGDGVKSFELLRAWSVDVTNYDASYVPEYVSVGVASSPFFGAGIDGAKYFSTDYTGGRALTNLIGFRREAAATNNLLYCRDLLAGAKAGAWIPSTTGAAVLSDDFSSYANTAAMLAAGWTEGNGGVATLVSGKLRITQGTANGITGRSFPTTVGRTYVVAVEVTKNAANYAGVVLGSTLTNGSIYVNQSINASGVITVTFVATHTTTYLTCQVMGSVVGAYHEFDNITITEAALVPTLTATGLDGIANTATTLTASAADATILQPRTLASADRCASAYVKRRTGTGTISFTQDGGSTWTDITSQINSSTWSRVEITATLANPSVGFKISTIGDEIDVDCVQNEAGIVATSPIITTSVTITRNAESLTYQTASNWSDTAGTAYIEVEPYQWSVGGLIGSATNGLLESASDSGATAYDGTNSANGPTGTPSGRKKLAMRWGSGAMTVASGGSVGTPGTYDGGMGLASIGIAVNSSAYCNNVAIYTYAMTDAELQEVTK